jgi:hypothetical protein
VGVEATDLSEHRIPQGPFHQLGVGHRDPDPWLEPDDPAALGRILERGRRPDRAALQQFGNRGAPDAPLDDTAVQQAPSSVHLPLALLVLNLGPAL